VAYTHKTEGNYST